MPLTSTHQEFIESVIDDFFDFPTDEMALQTNVLQLQQAFEHRLTDTSNAAYTTLQNCLTNPENYLLKLETLDQKIIPTVGEVQSYIVELAVKRLKEKTTSFESKSESLIKLDTDAIFTILQRSSSFNAPFVSTQQHNAIDLDHLDLPEEVPDRLFTQNIWVDLDFRMFRAEIKISIPNMPITIEEYNFNDEENVEDIDNFETDKERQKYIKDELHPILESKVIQKIAAIALMSLIEAKTVTYSEVAKMSPPSTELITFTFYYNLIKSKQYCLADISDLESYQVYMLASPSIIDLIRKEICDITLAKTLSAPVISAPYFQKKIKENSSILQGLTYLSVREEKNILPPNIIYLQQTDLISLVDAKNLTIGARKLLENECYFALVKNRKLNIKEIERISEAVQKNLCTHSLSALIQNKMLSIREARKLKISKIQRDVLNNPFIAHLLREKKLDLSFILSRTPAECENLRIPVIAYLISERNFSIDLACHLKTTPECREFLNTNICFDLIRNNKLKLETIIAFEKYCDILLTNSVMEAIREKTVNVEQLIHRLLQNPLLLYLVRNQLLDVIEGLPHILQKSDATALPMEFKEKYGFTDNNRKLIDEFTHLAKDGLLFEENLPLVYKNLPSFIMDDLEMKESLKGRTLLTNPELRIECLKNLFYRLEEIHAEDPIFFHGNKRDTLDCITATIKKYRVISPPILSQLFCVRLMGIYHGLPYTLMGKKDTLKIIIEEIRAMLFRNRVPTEKFFFYLTNFLLKTLLRDLEDRLSSDTSKKLSSLSDKLNTLATNCTETTWTTTLDDLFTFVESQKSHSKTTYSLSLFSSTSLAGEAYTELAEITKTLRGVYSIIHSQQSSLPVISLK